MHCCWLSPTSLYPAIQWNVTTVHIGNCEESPVLFDVPKPNSMGSGLLQALRTIARQTYRPLKVVHLNSKSSLASKVLSLSFSKYIFTVNKHLQHIDSHTLELHQSTCTDENIIWIARSKLHAQNSPSSHIYTNLSQTSSQHLGAVFMRVFFSLLQLWEFVHNKMSNLHTFLLFWCHHAWELHEHVAKKADGTQIPQVHVTSIKYYNDLGKSCVGWVQRVQHILWK